MPASYPPRRRALRLVILNNSALLLTMLCEWLAQHGHHCETALMADMPRAYEDVGRFINKHRPDVVVYDVGKPYPSSWDLLEVIRRSPALQTQPFVVTTPNKRKLDQAVGRRTAAIEIGGGDMDLRQVLAAVEAAANGSGPPRA